MVDYSKPYPGGFRNKGEVGTPTPFTKAVGNNLQNGIADVVAAHNLLETDVETRLSEEALNATIGDVVEESTYLPATFVKRPSSGVVASWAAASQISGGTITDLKPTSPVSWLFSNVVDTGSGTGIGAAQSYAPLGCSVRVWGNEVEFRVYCRQASAKVKYAVDGEYLTSETVGQPVDSAAGGATRFLRLQFADAGPHVVTIVGNEQIYLRSIVTVADGTFAPALFADGPVMGALWDSFGAGTGTPNEVQNFGSIAALVAEDLFEVGVTTIINAQAGTGLINEGPGAGTYTQKYSTRLASLLAVPGITDLYVELTPNDRGQGSKAAIKAAATALFDAAVAVVPTIRIHVNVAPSLSKAKNLETNQIINRLAGLEAATAHARVFSIIDSTAEGWLSEANRPRLLNSDGVHPQAPDGVSYRAARTSPRLAKAVRQTVRPISATHPLLRSLTAGVLWIVEPGSRYGGWDGIPADGALVPNIAQAQCLAMLGSATPADAQFTFDLGPTVWGTNSKLELTALGGLHGIVSQANDIGANVFARSQAPAALKSYLLTNTADPAAAAIHDIAVVDIVRTTRPRLTDTNQQHFTDLVRDVTPTGNRLAWNGSHVYPGTDGVAIGTLMPVGAYATIAYATNWNGSKPGSAAATWLNVGQLGSSDIYSSTAALRQNKAGAIVYSSIGVDLTVAGISRAAFTALIQNIVGEWFAPGGDYYGDEWTPDSSIA